MNPGRYDSRRIPSATELKCNNSAAHAIISLVLPGVIIAGLITYIWMKAMPLSGAITLTLILAGVFFSFFWYYPLTVGVADGVFYIRRILRTTRIPVSRIAEARIWYPSVKDGAIWSIRSFGLRLGWFKSWTAGLYFSYVTDFGSTFMVTLRPDDSGRVRRYVVSCTDPEALVETLLWRGGILPPGR